MRSAALYLLSHQNRLMRTLDENHEVSRVVDDLMTHMLRLRETEGIKFEDMVVQDVYVDDAGVLHINLGW